ncbi:MULTISPECIES: ROK family transcriptional regulator [Clostridium]|uniref:ROK family transcriptional regulator n=1 Tax=Clostridium TaxID=1485 RepID=UPI0008253E2F|nr:MULTISPECIES: ROK family transcriptional regulator [Clostridium]PJI07170.1 ROK family transcriptional regulator [Clostridium sp. CT7]
MREILRQLSDRELSTLNIVHKNDIITKKDLQGLTGMTLTTLNRVMKSLEDKKLITEVGTAESTGGRKAVEYSVIQRGIYVIGIDISRTYVRIIVSNLKMDILKKEEFFMNDSFSPEKTVQKIVSLIEQKLLDLSIDKSEILGIGIGTVGPLDRQKGVLLKPKNFFNDLWNNVPLKDMIEEKLSIPCFIDNGANNAVLAEYLFGMGRKLEGIVYINCGIGIRSAAITSGTIIRAMNNSEDAFANMIVDLNDKKFICGSIGSVESYSSIEAVVKRFNLKDEKRSCKQEKFKEEEYKKILELAASGKDELAFEIVSKGAYTLGIGLANLVRLLNPQLVILYGPLIKNYESYYEKCVDAFRKNNCTNNKVVFSKGGKFKENAIAVGSALMVIENYLGNNIHIGGK